MFEIKDIPFIHNGCTARTLDPEYVLENHSNQTGKYTRTHGNGWTITGTIGENYVYWINSFEASHPIYGRVWGNFEDVVYADSKEGYLAFIEAFPYIEWDYEDI